MRTPTSSSIFKIESEVMGVSIIYTMLSFANKIMIGTWERDIRNLPSIICVWEEIRVITKIPPLFFLKTKYQPKKQPNMNKFI